MADFHSLKNFRGKKINGCDWSRQIFHGRKFKKLKIVNFLEWLFWKTFCPRKYFRKWKMALTPRDLTNFSFINLGVCHCCVVKSTTECLLILTYALN